MEYLGDGEYSQMYHSDNFFILEDVLDYEDERLWDLGAKIVDYEISLNLADGEVLRFYLEIFFESRDGRELNGQQLFNFKNR
jgi:hypothetical protein